MQRCLSVLSLFFIIILTGCNPADEKISMNVESLLGGFGLKSNVFKTEPEQQLGTIIFYHSPRVIQQLESQLKVSIHSEVVIQIQGQLAKKILDQMAYFSKGTLRWDENGVVYVFGEMAQDLYADIQKTFTIDDVHYLEEKEVVIFSGSQALTVCDTIKNAFENYYSQTPHKFKRVLVTTYVQSAQITKDFLYAFYDDLTMALVSNPIKTTASLVTDVGKFTLGGVEKISLFTAELWVTSFDSVSKFGAFMTGAEMIPESVVIRKTIKMVADVGYLTIYNVSQVFQKARQGIFINPLVTIDIASETLKHLTQTAEVARSSSTEIVVGYISDNVELLGELLNLVHENIVGDLFIFVGRSMVSSLTITSYTLRAIIRFSGNGLSALVGTFSVEEPWDVKWLQYKNVFHDVGNDLKSVWHELMKFLRLR